MCQTFPLDSLGRAAPAILRLAASDKKNERDGAVEKISPIFPTAFARCNTLHLPLPCQTFPLDSSKAGWAHALQGNPRAALTGG